MRKMKINRALATTSSYLAVVAGDAAFGTVLAAAFAAALLIIPPAAWGQTAQTRQVYSQARPPAAAAPARNTTAAASSPTAPQPAPPPPAVASHDVDGHDVIARVGTDNLTADDIRAYIGLLDDRQRQALAHDPTQLSQTVRVLLSDRVVLQEVLAKKWEQQPDVAAKLQRARDRAIVELYLESVTTPPASYPSDAEVQKVYDANAKSMVVPRQFQLSQIIVAVPQGADAAAEAAAKKKVDDFEAKLAAPGADFATISKAGNDAPNGGEIGWLPETQIRPEIQAQVVGLAANAVSKPIRLEDGWHIMKLIDTKASYTPSLPEVHDQLVQQMRTERATMNRRAYVAQLLQQHPPMLNEFALTNLLSKSAQ
jgi:peptidylprolyl isomerase